MHVGNSESHVHIGKRAKVKPPTLMHVGNSESHMHIGNSESHVHVGNSESRRESHMHVVTDWGKPITADMVSQLIPRQEATGSAGGRYRWQHSRPLLFLPAAAGGRSSLGG